MYYPKPDRILSLMLPSFIAKPLIKGIGWLCMSRKERIISRALDSQEGRELLIEAMLAPINAPLKFKLDD